MLSSMRRSTLTVVTLLSLVSIAPASVIYEGSLTTADGGLVATAPWDAGSTLHWKVDTTTTSGYWHYAYDLTVASKDISHIILETSPGRTSEDFINFKWSFDGAIWTNYLLTADDVKDNTAQQGNPSLPATVHGIKFDMPGDSLTLHISFDTRYQPVWGDFYAKDGKNGGTAAVLWNEGFAIVDPTVAAANGSVANHLLVPDSQLVPEPATAGLLLMGVVGLICRRSRA